MPQSAVNRVAICCHILLRFCFPQQESLSAALFQAAFVTIHYISSVIAFSCHLRHCLCLLSVASAAASSFPPFPRSHFPIFPPVASPFLGSRSRNPSIFYPPLRGINPFSKEPITAFSDLSRFPPMGLLLFHILSHIAGRHPRHVSVSVGMSAGISVGTSVCVCPLTCRFSRVVVILRTLYELRKKCDLMTLLYQSCWPTDSPSSSRRLSL